METEQRWHIYPYTSKVDVILFFDIETTKVIYVDEDIEGHEMA